MCGADMKRKIIIDTDIGDDIDDALAIALALNSPEIEVVGITTVYKNAKARARLAKKLLLMAGREDIPVYTGIGQPLINKVSENEIPNHYLKDMDDIPINEDIDGIDFIINTIIASEGDISLVPIGPLTNIAMAIMKRPEIKSKIKNIVLMGGAYYFHCNEYNIECDPEAARVVFQSGVKIKAVGLDVTLKCQLTHEDINRIENQSKDITKFLSNLISHWRGKNDYLPILHDPLAIYAVFNDGLLEFNEERIVVETKGEFTRGATFNQTGYRWGRIDSVKSNIWTAKNVDGKVFGQLFMNRVFE
jgi:purine nucleosidase/pyrimidine-specific ribonucleoside hydrolase